MKYVLSATSLALVAAQTEVLKASTSMTPILMVLTILISATSLTFIALLLLLGIPRSQE